MVQALIQGPAAQLLPKDSPHLLQAFSTIAQQDSFMHLMPNEPHFPCVSSSIPKRIRAWNVSKQAYRFYLDAPLDMTKSHFSCKAADPYPNDVCNQVYVAQVKIKPGDSADPHTKAECVTAQFSGPVRQSQLSPGFARISQA